MRPSPLVRAALAAFLLAPWGPLALTACSKPPPPTPDAGVEPPHAIYLADPTAEGNPFPDDRLAQGGQLHTRDGFWRDFSPASGVNRTMATFQKGNEPSFNSVAGHGNAGYTLVKLSEAVDPASVPGHVLFAQKVGGAWQKAGEAVTLVENLPNTQFLAARAPLPLQPALPAALVLTRGLKTQAGAAFGRGRDFAQAAASSADLAPVAQALGLAPDEVLLLLPLSPQDAAALVKALGDWAAQEVPVPYALHLPDGGDDPVGFNGGPMFGVYYAADGGLAQFNRYLNTPNARDLAEDGGLYPDGGADLSDIGGLVLGTFDSRDLRKEVRDGSGKLVSDSIDPELAANPDLAPAVALRFVLVLPKGPPPYRVVIGGHGLGSRNTFDANEAVPNSFCGSLGELFARSGLGCIGIDAVSHGSRGSYIGLFNLADLKTTRDNFRQTHFDLLQLSRALTQLDFDPDHPGPDLDAASVGYFGNSLGSILGTAFLATDHRVKFGVLNVPAGGLGMMFGSPYIHDLLGTLVAASTGLDPQSPDFDTSLVLFQSEGQAVFEGADPYNYAALTKGKHVLAQEGVGDQTLPNPNTEELFAAMGLGEVTEPRSDPAGLSGFSRVDPAAYGLHDPSFNPHGVFYRFPARRHQAVQFLVSKGTTLAPLEP